MNPDEFEDVFYKEMLDAEDHYGIGIDDEDYEPEIDDGPWDFESFFNQG